MKNKFFNNLLLTVLSLGFIGCEDYVDYEASEGYTIVADDYFKTSADYEAALVGTYPKYGFEVKKHINITDNVAVACAVEKYRMMEHSQILADVMMYDEERYFLYRRNPNLKKDDYHIFVIEKKETL